jgi:hypothetical protein
VPKGISRLYDQYLGTGLFIIEGRMGSGLCKTAHIALVASVIMNCARLVLGAQAFSAAPVSFKAAFW